LGDKKVVPRLIQSAVFHYEFEFIHPFMDGNGRMGRLWQNLILMDYHPIFEFLPIEMAILKTQARYCEALGKSDKEGESTYFIEYSLQTILQSLEEFIDSLKSGNRTPQDRLAYASREFGKKSFGRKDYLSLFSNISTATASRDLQKGVELSHLKMTGDKVLATYQFVDLPDPAEPRKLYAERKRGKKKLA
jgi:Fic family protein